MTIIFVDPVAVDVEALRKDLGKKIKVVPVTRPAGVPLHEVVLIIQE
jgi:hypothetical protein